MRFSIINFENLKICRSAFPFLGNKCEVALDSSELFYFILFYGGPVKICPFLLKLLFK